MELKSFLESWKDYTIRDKIILGSSVVPLVIFVFSFIFLFEVFWTWNFDSNFITTTEVCGELTLYGNYGPIEKNSNFCKVGFYYAISPIMLLLSTISLGIFSFFST